MPVKLRLQRHGRKRRAFYYIVVADSRAKRDGRFIERIGYYDPNHNPAHVNIDHDAALDWMKKGAQPTPTVRNILSGTGVLFKKHLQRGVDKGALTQEKADKQFADWVNSKTKDPNSKFILFDLSKFKPLLLGDEADTDFELITAPTTKVKAPVAEAPVVETTTVEEPATETTTEGDDA
jgi:small subunit ribosomal protein S16